MGRVRGAREVVREGGNSRTEWAPPETEADPATETNDEEADPGEGLS